MLNTTEPAITPDLRRDGREMPTDHHPGAPTLRFPQTSPHLYTPVNASPSSSVGAPETACAQASAAAITSFTLAHLNGQYVCFRAHHAVYGNVILKCCHQNAPVDILGKLHWEYHITRGLDPKRFIVPFETIHEFESSPFGLVFPDFRNPQYEAPSRNRNRSSSRSSSTDSTEGGRAAHAPILVTEEDEKGSIEVEYMQMTLGDYLQRYGALDMDNALLILSYTVSSLKVLHERGIMFRNFSFSTLLLEFPSSSTEIESLNWSQLRVKLYDFTHASKLTGELVPHSIVEFVVFGDMRFMSPESTGRMNRAVDVRSDFYSLGMLIHGALTGSTPPAEASVLSLLHYHLAVVPVPLIQHYTKEKDSNIKTPQFIRKAANTQLLLGKLIAKLPEDRYQTCDDILRDLNMLIVSAETMTDFSPQLSWKPEDALSHNQLYGCKQEVEHLRAFQDKSYTSTAGGVALVIGPSGVGKTTVVQELILPAFSAGGIYCSGKFDQFKRDLPFVPFIQAFTDMVNLLLLEDGVRLEAIVDQIHSQLQENVMVLLSLIPNLSHLLNQEQRHTTVTAEEQQKKKQKQNRYTAELFSTLAPSEMLTRMHKSFTTFLEIISSHKSLTLFIDDVQWADWSTSQYIRRLLDDGIPAHVLLVLSYRGDEIHDNQYLHDLGALLRAHKKSGQIQLCEEYLPNMSVGAIAEMLDDIFQRKFLTAQTVSTDTLATLTYEKTLGNPYYVRRFLQMLLDSGALTRSADNGTWAVNMEQMRQSALMENVADMLVLQMQTIHSGTKLVLKLASLIGTQFDLHTLAQVLRSSHATIWTSLMLAAAGGYLRVVSGATYRPVGIDNPEPLPYENLAAFAAQILPRGKRVLTKFDGMHVTKSGVRFTLDQSSVSSNSVEKVYADDSESTFVSVINSDIIISESEAIVRYQWEHDRVQQAAYRLIDPSARDVVHYAVGIWMLYATTLESVSDRIFNVVHHLEMAKAVFTDPQDRLNLAKLFLVGANRAKSCSAFGSAVHYSCEAVSLLDESVWTSDYDFAFFAHFSLLENEYANGHLQAMKAQIDALHFRDLQQQSKVLLYEQEILYNLCLGQIPDGLESGMKALDMLGYELSSNPSHIAQLLQKALRTSSEVAALLHLPLLTDPISQAAVRIMVGLLPSIYFIRMDLMPSLILTLVDVSVTKGNSDFGAYGYILCAMLLSGKEDNIMLGREYGKLGRAVLHTLPPSPLKCHVYKTSASHIQFWSEPLSNAFKSFDIAIAAGKQAYNFEYISYAIVEMLYYKFISGQSLSALKIEMKAIGSQVEAYNIPVALDYRLALNIMVTHLSKRKLTPVTDYLSPALEKTVKSSAVTIPQYTYWFGRLILHYLADELEIAQYAAEELDKIRETHKGTLFDSEYILFKGLVAARLALELDERESVKKRTLMQVLQSVISKYEPWAKCCISTFGCRLALLQGCNIWLQGDLTGGLNQLDSAIQLAQQHGFQNIEALANEMAGRFWIRDKKRHIATVYMSSAHRAYKAWGAEWKAHLIGHYDVHSHEDVHDSSRSADGQNAEQQIALSGNQVDEVDVEMLCDWTIALASEKTHDSLLEQFIRLAMLYTGSRKGYMLWINSDKIESSTVDDMSTCVYSIVDDNGSLCTVLRSDGTTVPMPLAANYTIRTRKTISESSPAIATFIKSGQLSPPHGSFLFYPVVHHDVCVGLLYLANDLSQKVFSNTKRLSLLKLLSSQLNISFENMRLLEELRTYNEVLEKQTTNLEEVNKQLTNEIVERKKAEIVAVQAASANRSFLQSMSHELRTPLNCIIGMSELLSQTELSKDQVEILDPILQSARDLLQIISDILDFSKIESGKLVLSKHDFCLREIIENAIDSIVSQASEKAITLAIHYPNSVPSNIHNDSIRIGQVLRNLLANAAKFTLQGEVILAVSAALMPGRDEYMFTIDCQDTGIGVPEDQMDKLFKAFSQIDNSTTCRSGGTGLGLSISKHFADKLGGDLVCTSKVDVGSTFTFTFETSVLPELPLNSSIPHSLTFVICHPKTTIRQMLTGYLDINGSRQIVVHHKEIDAYQPEPDKLTATILILDRQSVNPQEIKCTLPKIFLSESDGSRNLDNTSDLYILRTPFRRVKLFNVISSIVNATPLRTIRRVPTQRPQFSLKVLMAEDNSINMSVAEKMLRKFGIIFDAVENGLLGVEAAQRKRYDLIFLDIMMPVMDGHQATRMIRKTLPSDGQPIIIALTANVFAMDKSLCFEVGMDDVLTKPITFRALEAMLLKHFEPIG